MDIIVHVASANPSSFTFHCAIGDRLTFARLDVEPLAQALIGAASRHFLGLATGSVGGGEAVYAVSGDDAVYRLAASGAPHRRLEFDLPPTPRH